MILSSKHAKELTAVETPVRRSERFGSANNSSNKFLFPPECFIFGIYRKQCSKHDEYNRILLKDGEQTIRLAAEHKLPLFYRKNKAIDLISSELRFHESCYKTFTYGYSNSFTEKKLDLPLLNKSQSEEDLQEQGNYEDVKKYINQHVLTDRNAVSLNVLHTTCGLPFYFAFNKTSYARYGSY